MTLKKPAINSRNAANVARPAPRISYLLGCPMLTERPYARALDWTSSRLDDARRGARREHRVLTLGGEDVQPEPPAHLFAHPHAANAVAVVVEARGVDRYAHLAGDRGEYPAADAALGRHSHVERPLARSVVHPARVHDAEHVSDQLAGQDRLGGERVDEAVRERRGHHREVAAGDLDRALLQVQPQDRLD